MLIRDILEHKILSLAIAPMLWITQQRQRVEKPGLGLKPASCSREMGHQDGTEPVMQPCKGELVVGDASPQCNPHHHHGFDRSVCQ